MNFSYHKVKKCLPLVLLLILLFSTACQSKTPSVPVIQTSSLSDYLSYQQCEDGGFAQSIHPSIIAFTDLYDTYCALHILNMLDTPIPRQEHCIKFIQKVNCQDLILKDDFDEVFYYLMVAHYLNYEIPEQDFALLSNYIISLQTDEGAIKPNQDFTKIGGNVDYNNIYSSFYLMAVTHFVELSHFYTFDIDSDALINYLKTFSYMDIDSSLAMTAASVLIEANQVWPANAQTLDLSFLQTLYTSGFEIVEEKSDISHLRNTSIIANYLGRTNELISYLQPYYCIDGFSINPNEQESHIMATRIGLQTCKLLSISLDQERKNHIIDMIQSNQFYDGRFVFNRKDISYDTRISDTFQAILLLEELGQLDLYQSDLQSFYRTQTESLPLREHTVEDGFYLLSIAFYCGLPVDASDISWFKNAYCEYVNKEEVVPNYLFYTSVMESPFIWNEPISNEIKNQLIASYEKDSVIKTKITQFLQLYYQYTVLKVIDENTDFYQTVIDFYNENYDELILPYFAASYISNILQKENLSSNIIERRDDILKALNQASDDCLFRFPEDKSAGQSSFSSTRGVIKMIHSFSQ